MKREILIQFINIILNLISPELLKELVDKFLDMVEEKVKSTENTIDDMIILPICAKIREAFDVEDAD